MICNGLRFKKLFEDDEDVVTQIKACIPTYVYKHARQQTLLCYMSVEEGHNASYFERNI